MARRMVAPINSVKYYVQRAVTSVAGAGILNEVVVDAVVASAVSSSNEVLEGSIVKAVYVETWIIGEGASGIMSAFNVSVEKKPADATPMTNSQSLNLMVYPNKKNVLYTTQGLVASEQGSNAVSILRQWFAIPKGKQRMGLGDQLMINFSNISTTSYLICGFYTYKEYR